MLLISKVARRSARIPLLVAEIYALLTLAAVSMVYLFLLMLDTSVCNWGSTTVLKKDET